MMSAGGITALYPSKVQYEYVSPYIPPGHDTFGEVLSEAHARHIRIVSRWDFSKARKDAYDAHPEWFFKMADGQPAIYNGLYQACINGGWYRQKAVRFLAKPSIAMTSTAASSIISPIPQRTTASVHWGFATATIASGFIASASNAACRQSPMLTITPFCTMPVSPCPSPFAPCSRASVRRPRW